MLKWDPTKSNRKNSRRREVGDSKPNGHYFKTNKENLTYIYSALCVPSKTMQPFSNLFDKFSQQLRKAIHIEGMDPNNMVQKHLGVAKQLKNALSILRKTDDIEKAISAYEEISLNEREMSLGGIIFDNFYLERTIGLTAAQLSKDPKCKKEFISLYQKDFFYYLADHPEKYDLMQGFKHGIDIFENKWKFDFISEFVKDEVPRVIAPYILKTLSKERTSIYSAKTMKKITFSSKE